MAIARAAVVMLGTDESTGVTITNTSTSSDTQKEILDSDAKLGYANAYLKFTSSVTAGKVEVEIHYHRITAQDYKDDIQHKFRYSPISGTKKIFIGQIPVSRFMSVTVKNDATGADITNVFVALEVFEVS